MLDQQRQLPDDPRALYHRPVNRFVADYIGSANFQEVRRAERQWHLAAGGAQIRAFSRLELPRAARLH